MNPLTLELNSLPADLPAKQAGVVKLQRALAALADLETRSGDYSWPLTLPPTPRNATIFKPTALHAQGLDKFSGSYSFVLTDRGGRQWRGVFRVSSFASLSGYTGTLYLEGFGWASALSGKKLSELTTLRPVENYDGSQLEAILGQDCDTTDVQFPLVSFGNFFAPPLSVIGPDGAQTESPAPASAALDYALSVDDYYPAVYYVSVVRAIFREAGYFAQGPCLDSEPEPRRWCITAAGSAGDGWPWGTLLPAAGTGGGSSRFSYFNDSVHGWENNALAFDESASAGNIDGLDLGGEMMYFAVPVPTVTSGGTRALSAADALFTAPRAGAYTFAYSATLSSGHQTIAEPLLSQLTPSMRDAFARVAVGLLVRRSGAGYTAAEGGVIVRGSADTDRVPAYDFVQDMLNSQSFSSVGSAGVSVFLEAGDVVQLALFTRRRLVDVTQGTLMTREEFVVNFSATAFACTAYADNDGVSETRLLPARFLPPLAQADVLRDFLLRTNTVPVVDNERRTVTLLSRDEHRTAQGPALDLDAFTSPAAAQYLPALNGAASVVFSPAEAPDDALAPADAVSVALPGDRVGQAKAVPFLFAATGLRPYYLTSGATLAFPTIASKDDLATARSEVAWDVTSAVPRVLRYLGPDRSGPTLPFAQRQLAPGQADYGGALALAGEAGVVATRYQELLASAARGHILRLQIPLTPALYHELRPGREVWYYGAGYSVEAVTGFDPADPSSNTQVDLLRRI